MGDLHSYSSSLSLEFKAGPLYGVPNGGCREVHDGLLLDLGPRFDDVIHLDVAQVPDEVIRVFQVLREEEAG